MGIQTKTRSVTPGTRHQVAADFSELTKSKPEKSLTQGYARKFGRNHRGVKTTRHRGGGHKRNYRQVDFRRDKQNIQAQVTSIESVSYTHLTLPTTSMV